MSLVTTTETQSPAIHSFLRSLNMLLKSARMYGMDHAQTVSQSRDTWEHLQAALGERRKTGLQLAVWEHRLMVDGVAVKAGPAEQSFARMLSAADLASVSFLPQATAESFREMVRIFAETGTNPEGVAARLKAALGDESRSGLRVNEVRFVPAGSERAEGTVAARLLAHTLGTVAGQMQEILHDPGRLLQLITAVEGASAGTGAASKAARDGSSGMAEEETAAVIRLLGKLAREGGREGAADPDALRSELARLSAPSQAALHQAVAEFAETMSPQQPGPALLLRVAEHLAIRLAMERYERGDTRVDAVTETLQRMEGEIASLRETVAAYEHKLKEPGFEGDGPGDALQQEFWAQAPDAAKLDLLLSEHAWRMPPRHVREFVDHLAERGEAGTLQKVLLNYVNGIDSALPEARRTTALGLKELAEHYPRAAGQPLGIAVRRVGEQLAKETDPELQRLLGATFVLLGQEAATRRRYAAVLQMMSALEALAPLHGEMAASLRARIGLENRIPDFLEEALRVPQVPLEFMEVLRRVPLAAEHIAGRFSRCARRRERDRMVKLAEELGPAGVTALREEFQSSSPAGAVVTVGLLSRLAPAELEEPLRARLREWNRLYHDGVVRQIASAASPVRGRLLAHLLAALDPLVVPLALDEIGMSEDPAPTPVLLAIAAGELPELNAPYLQLKAIEALGRLRASEAVPLLTSLVERTEPRRLPVAREIQIAAAQSLARLDPDEARAVLSSAGLTPADLEPAPLERSGEQPGVRQRYYPRVKLSRPVAGRIITMDGEFPATVRELSLGGGLCSCEQRFSPGAPATMRMKTGMRSVEAKVILREPRSELTPFEIVDMDLEDRARLRSLLQAARR